MGYEQSLHINFGPNETNLNNVESTQSPGQCQNGYYQCQGGSKCIPLNCICDYFYDCPQREDESNDIVYLQNKIVHHN